MRFSSLGTGRQSSLLVTRSFLSSPCTIFDPTDFCHLLSGLCIRPKHMCHGGFEIPQTESALVRRYSTFFFPALPDKCETWSVNNWNSYEIEIKFPRKKETNKEQNQPKTSKTHTQAKAPGQANLPGKFAN